MQSTLVGTDEDMILDDQSARRYDFEDAPAGFSIFAPSKDSFSAEDSAPMGGTTSSADTEDDWEESSSSDSDDDLEDDDF